MKADIVGIAWYRESEWRDFHLRMADPETFDYPYAEWILNAQEKIQELENLGITVRKTPIPIDDFLLWCEKKRSKPDGSARAEYVARKTRNNEDSEPGAAGSCA